MEDIFYMHLLQEKLYFHVTTFTPLLTRFTMINVATLC